MLCLAAGLSLHSCGECVSMLPSMDGAGLSGLYAGEVGGSIIIAGGCNFPDKPVTEGGKKRFYSEIYSLEGDGWKNIGHLPEPSAYGACLTVDEGLLILGGANSEGTSDAQWLITEEGVSEYGLLPKPLEQAAWCTCDGDICLAGGLSNGITSEEVYRMKEGVWSVAAILPRPIVQGVATYQRGILTIWGGYDPVTKEALKCGYSLNTDGVWSETPADVTFVGSVCLDGYAAGGCDADVFTSAIRLSSPDQIREYQSQPVEYYKIRGRILHFDPETFSWVEVAESEHLARAGAAISRQGDYLICAGGEVKPGIRSPEVCRIRLDVR